MSFGQVHHERLLVKLTKRSEYANPAGGYSAQPIGCTVRNRPELLANDNVIFSRANGQRHGF